MEMEREQLAELVAELAARLGEYDLSRRAQEISSPPPLTDEERRLLAIVRHHRFIREQEAARFCFHPVAERPENRGASE